MNPVILAIILIGVFVGVMAHLSFVIPALSQLEEEIGEDLTEVKRDLMLFGSSILYFGVFFPVVLIAGFTTKTLSDNFYDRVYSELRRQILEE